MAKLTEQELNAALRKIRNKYEKLITDFKKSRVLIESFEERYIRALKSKMDLTTFFIAEIEAVEELYKREEEKRVLQEKENLAKKENKPNIADKIYEENKNRIRKYTRIQINHQDSDEEIEYLFGALREFINNYFPALVIIYKEKKHTTEGEKISDFSNKFLTHYDYKGDIPISRQYITALERRPRDFKKIEYEHKFIMKETAFLLNEILELLDKIISKNDIPMPDKKLLIEKNKNSDENWFYEYFNNLTYKESIEKTYNFLKEIITDFRFKDIRRGFSL